MGVLRTGYRKLDFLKYTEKGLTIVKPFFYLYTVFSVYNLVISSSALA